MTGIPARTIRPAHAAEPCTRCGASGTHYLTCPSLRLPPGYRLTPGPAPDAPAACPPTRAERARDGRGDPLLTIARIVVPGVPAGPRLSRRAGQQAGRAGYRRARDRAAPGPGAGLITGGRPGWLCGGPDHPDWPLPPGR
jgi:hypothetical protein